MDPITAAMLQQGAQTAGSIGSDLVNNAQQKNQWYRQSMANAAMANAQNYYNSPAQQMKRLKEAGLNPNLIYGQASAGNTSASPQPAGSPNLRASNPIGEGQNWAGLPQAKAQLSLTKAQENLINMQVAKTSAETATEILRPGLISAQTGQTSATTAKLSQETKNLMTTEQILKVEKLLKDKDLTRADLAIELDKIGVTRGHIGIQRDNAELFRSQYKAKELIDQSLDAQAALVRKTNMETDILGITKYVKDQTKISEINEVYYRWQTASTNNQIQKAELEAKRLANLLRLAGVNPEKASSLLYQLGIEKVKHKANTNQY